MRVDVLLADGGRTQATPIGMIGFGLGFIALVWAQYFAAWHLPWIRERGPAQFFGRPIFGTVLGLALITLGVVELIA